MKKVLTILSVLFLMNQATSQVNEEWASRYNGPGNLGDASGRVIVDGSGNVYITGYSIGIGTDDDYATRKYNSSGGQLWTSRYDGPGSSVDRAYGIVVDGSGNVYVTGTSRSGTATNTEDYATVKYSSNGVQQWAARYNGTLNSNDGSYAIALDNTGNVYVTGSSFGSGGSGRDYVTIKYNTSGDEQWVQRYNGTGNNLDEAFRIAVSDSGNVYVTGYSRSGSGAGTEDCVTIKYNSSGVEQWVQRYNNGANEIGLSIAVDGSGNVYVAGFAWNGFSYIDCLTIKYNASGVQQWYNVLVENGTSVLYSLAVDASGNVYATGYSWASGINDDYITVKFNSAGTAQWIKYYNGPGNGGDTAYSLALDDLGNVYVTGTSLGSGTGNDYTTIKYNPSGVEQWVQRYDGPVNGDDMGYSIAIDNWGYVYVTGTSTGSGTGADYATIKYSQIGPQFTLNLTAFIQGFYNPGSNNMISDTARVYLRGNSSPYSTIDSGKRKLSPLGIAPVLFSNAVNGVSYYLEVKHRNSIATWSSSPISFTSGFGNYNFATVPTQAYGDNEIRVDLSPLRYAIYGGDVNQDGTVDATDLSMIDNDAWNFVTGYVKTDLTGDDVVDASDGAIADNNAANFVSKITP